MHHFSGTGGHSTSLAWTDTKSILACSVYHFVAIIRERERHCENVNRSFICCSQGERTAGLKLHILFLILISLHHLPLKFTFILTFRCVQSMALIYCTFVRSPGRSDETEYWGRNLLTLWSRSLSKCYLRIQSVPQREHSTSPLQRSTG
jgi:hypothetical protein